MRRYRGQAPSHLSEVHPSVATWDMPGSLNWAGAKREGALGVAQLIGLAKLLADRVLEDSEHLMA
ncbi:hypothetical protein [Pseudomonas sp. FP833]|uniref:hypothetical protein n=1 Tax=Pseudomonas sp. FP833 TaxID=2954102 RepID=UPI002736DC47|nr:hypothetical protein [Pseudomonas sp. FP833]WLI49522.1 hypothetical protein PSH63_24245 [Pseudomonas sp. FP833]